MSGDSGQHGKDWPGPSDVAGKPGDYAPTAEQLAAARRPSLKRRLWWVVSVVVALAVGSAGTYLITKDWSLNDYKASVATSAEAKARILPPQNLYCPDSNSDEGRKAIRKPLVVIDEPPVRPVVVTGKKVVVVVKATLTGDLVVCGNDARVALETTPRPSARILMQGGTDINAQTGGPMLFLVDSATVDPARVWFTNRKPQILNCTKATAGLTRPCASYYSTTPASPSPAPSPSPSPSKTD